MKTTVQLYKKARKNFDIVKSLYNTLVYTELPRLIYTRKNLKVQLYNARQNKDEDKIKFCKFALEEVDRYIFMTIESIKVIKIQIKECNTLLSKIGTIENERSVHNSITLYSDIMKHQLRNDSITTFDFTSWTKNELGIEVVLNNV